MLVTARSRSMILFAAGVAIVSVWGVVAGVTGQGPKQDFADGYTKQVQPILRKYCLECHSTKAKKGSLDLERFASLEQVRKDLKPWQNLIEQIETGEMPPKGKPQPTADERKQLLAWVASFLDAEARARTGDPGHVPLRRLSNAEYDCTIRDLTGVDLKPTREFPADGAAGEGFTNAAESLSDITPTLFARYLAAAKDIADHAVLLPDGFRFSPCKTRRDWTDESTAKLRKFYAEHTTDGRLAVQPYLAATVRHREALAAGKLAEIAVQEKLNAKYLGVLWQTLNDKTPSFPLDSIRARWRTASEKDIVSLAAEVTAWQTALWKFVPIGSYRYFAVTRQVANDPPAMDAASLKLAVKPAPGQTDVVVYLTSRGAGGQVVWQRPRLEAKGKPPLLLSDYAQFGPAYEVDYAAVFANSAQYLSAASRVAQNPSVSVKEIAKKDGLDSELLERWIAVVALDRLKTPEAPARIVPAVALTLLDDKTPPNAARPWINGWKKKGIDLPVLVANSSDKTEMIPGKVPARKVAVHPTPQEFVAVAWQSPFTGTVRMSAQVTHAHPACGNGVAWFLEHRQGKQAAVLAEGTVDLGGETKPPARVVKVEKGDSIVLAVDARDGNHVCDLTEINLTITETEKPGRVWDLAADIAGDVQVGNPHADKQGNAATWSFVRGPSRPTKGGAASVAVIPPASSLGRWREAALDPARKPEADKLAAQTERLLAGGRPAKENDPERVLYDNLVSPENVLLRGLDLARIAKAQPPPPSPSPHRGEGKGGGYGLAKETFDKDASVVVAANSTTEVRLPANLFRDREFVVEGRLDGAADGRLVQFVVTTSAPGPNAVWDGKTAVVASPTGPAYKKLLEGYADFRANFPWFLCFPNVVPTDEVVSLKMFHREDEPLERLFLGAEQKKRIDHLWSEHLFISQQAKAENDYLPQFIGYVTQDNPKELVDYFESQRPVFKKRADEFEKDYEAAILKQQALILDLASRAYRRPLSPKEKSELADLYQAIRKKGSSHDEAFRGVIARVLVAPAFLFRIEKPPAGKEPAAIDDWELATRLSYFLWSSAPDEELRQLAAAGKLRDPKVLAAQTKRMLQDERLRSLAIEFGTQWLHVRQFDQLKEKNEKLFPTFDAKLRAAIYEESILFFQDLFKSDQPVTQLLDADYTFLNESLAKHYGIPKVAGPEWRRVEGVRKYGRGGILGLASVQAKQSGASRTSPVLRGNWVVETLLGEKLPRPPADVPILPDEPGGADKLTTRQMTEKHVSNASCASCHVRIDPFGFAFENFDAIGRYRAKEANGQPVDTKAKLKDGTEFDGIDGLRGYLMAKKKDVIVRLFCRKLLGYALGRATTLSDNSVIDEMVAELNRNDGHISAAVLVIVRSPQFRMIRGADVE